MASGAEKDWRLDVTFDPISNMGEMAFVNTNAALYGDPAPALQSASPTYEMTREIHARRTTAAFA